MFVHARTGKLYFVVDEVQAFMSSERDIYPSYYANEPLGLSQGARANGVRISVRLDVIHSAYPTEALQRGWFRGKFEFPPVHGETLASAFMAGAIPFRSDVTIDAVNGVIRAAQAVPGASFVVRSRTMLHGRDCSE